MNKPITVSINPSYFCNFRCDFCYLTEQQLADTNKIDLDKLDSLLAQIPEIGHIDLYGGEIGALKKDYFYAMRDVIRKHYQGKINVITNFSMLHEGFYEDDFYLSVSYDWSAREKYDRVYQNMLMSPVPIAVLVLASPEVLKMNVDELIESMNLCSSVESVEIKPYSINQANCYNVSHADYEEFVKKWIASSIPKQFEFINEYYIEDVINKQRNAFSDDHVYITPNGNFGVLEFDLNDKEYFLGLDSFNDYIKWTEKEKQANVSNICRTCEYFGGCLTEHYRYVKDLDNSCNGYYNLINWYRNERMENTTRSLSSNQSSI
jgi:sulfatase maturation enzyme AslB (radical SAM superfamily)